MLRCLLSEGKNISYLKLKIMPALILLVIIIAVGSMFGNEKKTDQPVNNIDATIKNAFDLALTKYPRAVVQNAERIARYETYHFQLQFTFDLASIGMMAFSPNFPYGWTGLQKFWMKNEIYKPVGISQVHDKDTNLPLVVFPTFAAAVMSLCQFLSEYQNNPGRWHSLDPGEQQIYNEAVAQITPGYVV